MTNTALKALIDADITNKTASNSILNTVVGADLKSMVDYVDQEIAIVTPGTTIAKMVKTTISSAQVLDIFTTPINIVPAPGAGKMVIPSSILIVIRYQGTPYSDVGGSWKIKYQDDGSANITTMTSYLGSATFDKETIQSLFYSSFTTSGNFINKPIILSTTGNNPLGGDSGIDVYVTYDEITL